MGEDESWARKLTAEFPLARAVANDIIDLGTEMELGSGLARESLQFAVLCMTQRCNKGARFSWRSDDRVQGPE